jgi:hypothetical protein
MTTLSIETPHSLSTSHSITITVSHAVFFTSLRVSLHASCELCQVNDLVAGDSPFDVAAVELSLPFHVTSSNSTLAGEYVIPVTTSLVEREVSLDPSKDPTKQGFVSLATSALTGAPTVSVQDWSARFFFQLHMAPLS